jgi:hypothetical protein
MSKKSLLGFTLLALLISTFGVAEAGDFTFKPRVFTSAAYNDNVEEVSGGKGDYVGTIKPGFSTSYEANRVFFNLSYDLEYKDYLDNVKGDETNNYLDALGKVEAIKDRLYIEVSDSFKKVYEDNTRGDVPDGDTSSGTTDQNSFSVKPYLTIPLQERTQFTLGASFRDIWYSEEGNVDKRIYSAFTDVSHELSDAWSLTLGGGYERQIPRWEEGGYHRYNLLLGTKYSYDEGSYLEARWEPTHTDYRYTRDSDKQYHPYYLGVTHAFTKTMTGSLSTSLDFEEVPQSVSPDSKYSHQASLNNAYERGNFKVGLAYYDYETRENVSRSTYWRPSLSGDHSLTERFSLRYNSYVDLDTNPKSDKYWFTMLNLDYAFTDSAKVGLSYRFKINDTEGARTDYTSNTLGLTFSWAH